jgi:hypothetical protein
MVEPVESVGDADDFGRADGDDAVTQWGVGGVTARVEQHSGQIGAHTAAGHLIPF